MLEEQIKTQDWLSIIPNPSNSPVVMVASVQTSPDARMAEHREGPWIDLARFESIDYWTEVPTVKSLNASRHYSLMNRSW